MLVVYIYRHWQQLLYFANFVYTQMSPEVLNCQGVSYLAYLTSPVYPIA